MKAIYAVFENGVFRPTGPVDLPERCEVVFVPRRVGEVKPDAHLDRVYELLSRSCDTGDPLLSERHDEHQP